MKKNTGSVVIILGVGLVVLVLVGAAFFMVIKYKGGNLYNTSLTPTPSPISTSTDVSVMQKELDNTNIDSVDQEFIELNASASAL